jgi:hypothetical protein
VPEKLNAPDVDSAGGRIFTTLPVRLTGPDGGDLVPAAVPLLAIETPTPKR